MDTNSNSNINNASTSGIHSEHENGDSNGTLPPPLSSSLPVLHDSGNISNSNNTNNNNVSSSSANNANADEGTAAYDGGDDDGDGDGDAPLTPPVALPTHTDADGNNNDDDGNDDDGNTDDTHRTHSRSNNNSSGSHGPLGAPPSRFGGGLPRHSTAPSEVGSSRPPTHRSHHHRPHSIYGADAHSSNSRMMRHRPPETIATEEQVPDSLVVTSTVTAPQFRPAASSSGNTPAARGSWGSATPVAILGRLFGGDRNNNDNTNNNNNTDGDGDDASHFSSPNQDGQDHHSHGGAADTHSVYTHTHTHPYSHSVMGGHGGSLETHSLSHHGANTNFGGTQYHNTPQISPPLPGGTTMEGITQLNSPPPPPDGDGDDDDGDGNGNYNTGAKRGLYPNEQRPMMMRTRNANALYAMPWDQRVFVPKPDGCMHGFFSVIGSPRFWEKLDWAVRASWFTVLPTMILALEPETQHLFPIPSAVPNLAYWITMPTFGAGLRELFFAIKGFGMCMVLLIITIALSPGTGILTLVLFFFETLIAAFVAEESKMTTTYCLCLYTMQYITDPQGTGFKWAGMYMLTLLIALGFGLSAFLVPFIRWSSSIAEHYITVYGNSMACMARITYGSFWCPSGLQRELAVERLRQTLSTGDQCKSKVVTAMGEMEYEPHTGAYEARLHVRFATIDAAQQVMASGMEAILCLLEKPELAEREVCSAFGKAIQRDLDAMISEVYDLLARLCDFSVESVDADVQQFIQHHARFQQRVAEVHAQLMRQFPNHAPDESDILLGFYLFNFAELCEVLSSFQEESSPRNNIVYRSLFVVRDIQSVAAAVRDVATRIYRRRTITRRLKEAIKMALCMFVAGVFQVYALSNSPTSAASGAAIIAQLYSATGGESFQYATGRMMGTVLGSVVSLMSVQFANGRLWALYLAIACVSFAGAFVQAAPGYYEVGNTILGGMISVITEYQDSSMAMVCIQQNVFASLLYFVVAFTVWPVRSRTKVRVSLDISLRCYREAVGRLLVNLDKPENAIIVVDDTQLMLDEMRTHIDALETHLPSGSSEPTMTSVAFPQDSWEDVVKVLKKMHATVGLMRYAFKIFSGAEEALRRGPEYGFYRMSAHWILLVRMAPHTRRLRHLITATIDMFLTSLAQATVVSMKNLARVRKEMLSAYADVYEVLRVSLHQQVLTVIDDDVMLASDRPETTDANQDKMDDIIGGSVSFPSTPSFSDHKDSARAVAVSKSSSMANKGAESADKKALGDSTSSLPLVRVEASLPPLSPVSAAARVSPAASRLSPAASRLSPARSSTAARAAGGNNGVFYSYHISEEEKRLLRNYFRPAHKHEKERAAIRFEASVEGSVAERRPSSSSRTEEEGRASSSTFSPAGSETELQVGSFAFPKASPAAALTAAAAAEKQKKKADAAKLLLDVSTFMDPVPRHGQLRQAPRLHTKGQGFMFPEWGPSDTEGAPQQQPLYSAKLKPDDRKTNNTWGGSVPAAGNTFVSAKKDKKDAKKQQQQQHKYAAHHGNVVNASFMLPSAGAAPASSRSSSVSSVTSSQLHRRKEILAAAGITGPSGFKRLKKLWKTLSVEANAVPAASATVAHNNNVVTKLRDKYTQRAARHSQSLAASIAAMGVSLATAEGLDSPGRRSPRLNTSVAGVPASPPRKAISKKDIPDGNDDGDDSTSASLDLHGSPALGLAEPLKVHKKKHYHQLSPGSSSSTSFFFDSEDSDRYIDGADGSHSFLLGHKDVHSIEAFIFGLHALLASMNELQKAVLDMQYAGEMAKKL